MAIAIVLAITWVTTQMESAESSTATPTCNTL